MLKGECTVEGLSGRYEVEADQGVLIPGRRQLRFHQYTEEPLIFLSMRTEASGGRRMAYVPSVPSDVGIRVPVAQLGAQGIGSQLYLYALDERTIGVSPMIVDDWNRTAAVRMECTYEKSGDYVVAVVPERLADWYRLDDLLDSDYTITADPNGTRVTVDLTALIERQIQREAGGGSRPLAAPEAIRVSLRV